MPILKTNVVSDSVSSRVLRTLKKAAPKKITWFTLVELIVVITILAILATIGFLALSGYTQDAKDASVKANVRSIYSAIAAESALTGNSPRFYVVHDTGAALSDGSLAFVDGSPVTLSGGAYGTAGTNYSAGNPKWSELKLNPEKFRISGNGLPGGTATLAALVSGFGTAGAAYDAKLVTVGAMDAALAQTANGRSRSASFFQVTGVAPETKIASVVGNFPAPTAAQVTSSGATAGLVKAPVGTGALVDGGTSGGSTNSCSTTLPSCNGTSCVLTYSPTFVNQTWTKDSSSCGFACTGGYTGTSCGTPPAAFPSTCHNGTSITSAQAQTNKSTIVANISNYIWCEIDDYSWTSIPGSWVYIAWLTIGDAVMVVAKADISGTKACKTSISITANTTSITDWLANTNAMVTAWIEDHPAWKSCRDIWTTWYFPARNELNTIYTNKTNLWVFASYYWSSSYYTGQDYYSQLFTTGVQFNATMTESFPVRCVSRF